MNLKDKFSKSAEKYTLEKLEKLEGNAFESFEYIDEELKNQERFIPPIDYTDFREFVIYGLAEEYVNTSFDNIRLNYPYDGSRKEKEEWLNSANFYNLHVFEKHYPRTNGYLVFSSAGWGSNTGFFDSFYGISDNPEYVTIKGGPGLGNVYDTASFRTSNLALDLSTNGFTTEFWLKKDSFLADSVTKNEVLIQYWNNQTGSSDKGLVTLELYQYYDNTVAPFRLSVVSGAASESVLLGTTALKDTLYTNVWKHIAVSYDAQTASLYVDGTLFEQKTFSTTFGDIKGGITANIGGLVSGSVGAGKLSGSMDEFRHWKSTRTSEQIGRNWYTQVYGGTNTDDANTKLGVYLKFNEGITGNSTRDATILDYSGRATNGLYTNYVSTARSTSSAIVEAAAADTEFKDPILYNFHPDYLSSYDSLVDYAKRFDEVNQGSLYKMFPSFMLDEDYDGEQGLKKLVQVMASYFDEIQLQINYFNKTKNREYKGDFKNSSVKQLPFVRNLIQDQGLYIQDLFLESNLLEDLSNKTKEDNYEFEKRLVEAKNLIYQNIYNNLKYILKSKGTNKSIRNLLRTFGVDENLISITQYANKAKFNVNNTREERNNKRKFVRFNVLDGNEAVVFNKSDSASTRGFIPGYASDSSGSFSLETEIIFPKNIKTKNLSSVYQQEILTGSLFGVQSANSESDTTIPNSNADIKVLFIRDELVQSNSARFVLTSSNSAIPTLTSSLYFNVYDNSHWNFAVRLTPNSLIPNFLQKTGSIDYNISFYGVNTFGDQIIDEFELTSSMTLADAETFLKENKRVYAGAYNTNITGSNIYKTDVKLGNVRAWASYLTTNELRSHAFDSTNRGTEGNYLELYELNENIYNLNLNQNNTLIFNWNFDFSKLDDTAYNNVSGSGYPLEILGGEYPANGSGFVTSLTGALANEFVVDFAVGAPDKISRENEITFNKREIEDEKFSQDQQFIEYSFLVEKSPYAAISREMLKYFEAVKDFNNFIGDPVNRYRDDYKFLRKQRELFFKKIANEINVERFINFYKWVDHGLSSLIYQLIPEATNFNPNVMNVIESHVLERPKYRSKFPTLEFKTPTPEDSVETLDKLLINWKFNHAPIPAAQNTNCEWWNIRANRSGSIITSGDSNVDADREQIRLVKLSAINRSYATPQSFKVDDLYVGKDTREGTYWDAAIQEFGRITDVDGPGPLTQSVSVDYLLVHDYDVYDLEDCTDIIDPNKKVKRSFKIQNSREYDESYSYGKGHLLAPFTLWSSSIDTGYQSELGTNFKSGIGLNNHHDDVYSRFRNAPLQSPFTEGWVGGRQYRHIALNAGSDAQGTRPEGFYLLAGADFAGTASLGVVKTTYTSDGTHDFNTPRAALYREELAKRPLNIKNRQYSTASSRLGNFKETYEVVMTNGRTKNNLWFHDNSSQVLTETEVWNLNRGTTSPYLDATLPTRGVVKSVIVNRFSAPGGPEIQSRGYLEPTGEELSPYNAYPFRNTGIIYSSGSGNNDFTGSNGPRVNISTNIHTQNDGLRVLLSRRRGRYGVDSVFGSVRELDYNTTGSYQQVYENGLSQSIGVRYDNFFVSHQIPRADSSYSWITASMSGTYDHPGLKTCNFTIPSGSTSIDFPTASLATEWEFAGPKYSFVANLPDSTSVSDWVTESVRRSYNTSFNTSNTASSLSVYALTSNNFYLFNNFEGPYGYPTFRQITNDKNHFVIRQRQNNIINVSSYSLDSDSKKIEETKTFNEPPVFKKFKPIDHSVSVMLSEGDQRIVDNRYSYVNNKYFFSFAELNSLAQKNSVKPGNYDIVKKNYLSANKIGNVNFVSLTYEETVYPKAENTFLKEFRGRTNFTVDWWKSSRSAREQNKLIGAYNTTFPTASVWELDSERLSSLALPYPLTSSGTPEVHDIFGTGELQNPRTLFFKTPKGATSVSNILVSPLYARPLLSGSTDVFEQNKYVVGITPWDAPEQAGKEPFYYSDYDAYHEKIRLVGQDHTIVPEFKISDHVTELLENSEDVYTELTNQFSIVGGETQLSSSNNTNFLVEYSNSDFLQYFDIIKQEHSRFEETERVSLKCKSVMKFLPYEGFYPAQRTQQLAQLFSQSFGSALQTQTTASFRVLQTPLFGPGILYNSIKSGISLPYPVLTASAGAPAVPVTLRNVSQKLINNSLNFNNYFKYLNFENILSPLNFLSTQEIYDSETLEESATTPEGALLTGVPTKEYERGINNFLAESLEMFIDPVKSGIMLSIPENRIGSFDTTKNYVMDIDIAFRTDNYNRTSSYGPTTYANFEDYSMYCGPHQRGGSALPIRTIRLSFTPTASRHTIDDIISGLTASYIDTGGNELTTNIGLIQDTFPGFTDLFNVNKLVTTKTDYNNLQGIIPNSPIGTPSPSLVIQPKWQAPILDFSARTASIPAGQDASLYSVGMWHQYGALPTNSTLRFTVGPSPIVASGSLSSVLGMDKQEIEIGQIKDSHEVKEAIVAIPFVRIEGSENRQFFEIEDVIITDAVNQINGITLDENRINKAGSSVVDMVRKMQNYILPPKFDFLTNKGVTPIAMYLFEFSHKFSRQDLADIWQNLPPTSTTTDRDITSGFKVVESTISHKLNNEENAVGDIGFEFPMFSTNDKTEGVRWFIFKVKQKGNASYYQKLSSIPRENPELLERYPLMEDINYSYDLSVNERPARYNWPYDYFSMVELVKLDARVTIGKRFKGLNLAPQPPVTIPRSVLDFTLSTNEEE